MLYGVRVDYSLYRFPCDQRAKPHLTDYPWVCLEVETVPHNNRLPIIRLRLFVQKAFRDLSNPTVNRTRIYRMMNGGVSGENRFQLCERNKTTNPVRIRRTHMLDDSITNLEIKRNGITV